MEESQGYTAEAYFPEQMREHSQNHGEDQGLHERLAELLRDSRYEESDRGPERMAVPQNTDVHLETVETAAYAEEEAVGTRSAEMGSL